MAEAINSYLLILDMFPCRVKKELQNTIPCNAKYKLSNVSNSSHTEMKKETSTTTDYVLSKRFVNFMNC